MPPYTTGEAARLCNVTVRTVQYYDKRGLLHPSAFSEGGRRLYTDGDIHRLRVICFLREIGLSVEDVGRILQEEHPEETISCLLAGQGKTLEAEIAAKEAQLQMLQDLQHELKGTAPATVDAIGDLEKQVRGKKQRNRLIRRMLVLGAIMDVMQLALVAFAVLTGIWWPLIPGFAAVIGIGIGISVLYYRHTAFICPGCHRVFRSTFRQAFFAYHTPKLRKLTCPHCQKTQLCIEIYQEGASHAQD